MDFAPFVPWLSAAALIISIGTSVATLLTSGAKANASKLTAHDRRIQAVEAEMKHLPDRDAAHRLELAVEKLNGRIETLDERLKPVDALGRRLQEFLVRQAERGEK